MSHCYVSNLMHCTFNTKDRYPFIDSNLERLKKHGIEYDSRYVF